MAVPILQSLLLADHVYRDQATGKHIICGVFSTIFFTPNTQSEIPPVENNPVRSDERTGGNPAAGQAPGSGLSGVGRDFDGQQSNRPQPIQQLMQAGSP